MTKEELRKQVPEYWLGMAEESFGAAEICVQKGMLVSAVNRMYYTAFYIACSLLARNNKQYGKHSAVRIAFHRDLVRPGTIPAEFGELYDELFRMRNIGDYAVFSEFKQPEIENLLLRLRNFVDTAQAMK